MLNHNQEKTEKGTVLKRVNFYEAEYKTVGENVQFYGFQVQLLEGKITILEPNYKKAATDIVANWINSQEHYNNLINSNFTNFGTAVGWNEESRALYATQVFGG